LQGGLLCAQIPIAALGQMAPATGKNAATVPGIAVPGKTNATITEFEVPGEGAKPEGIFSSKHDGFTWYTAEGANEIGRFDPKKKAFEQFHLRPGTRPSTLVEHSGSGVQSTLYFASRDGGYIGEFDPNTRDVREFRIPGGKARLESLGFDHNGVIWFTVAKAEPPEFPQGSKVGRLNLFSSEIRTADVPTRNASPYGLAVNSKGTIFFTERDTARIGSVEADPMKVREYLLPKAGIGVEGLTITPDDALWFTDGARGYLGRFEPETGKFDEWSSPSGRGSRPGPIASIGGVVWYIETGTKPNMLVRFDTASDQFQSWAIPDNATVGHLYAESDSTLWLSLPASNHIAQVKVEAAK
jgi:virginiamycin B lyase